MSRPVTLIYIKNVFLSLLIAPKVFFTYSYSLLDNLSKSFSLWKSEKLLIQDFRLSLKVSFSCIYLSMATDGGWGRHTLKAQQ